MMNSNGRWRLHSAVFRSAAINHFFSNIFWLSIRRKEILPHKEGYYQLLL
jgi:hypothetical protein